MSQGRYVWIAGKKVYLNPEQQKERDKLINKERYRARQEKICGQADYRRCNGDCFVCPWRKEGIVVSYETEHFAEGFGNDNGAHGYGVVNCESTLEESTSRRNDTIHCVPESIGMQILRIRMVRKLLRATSMVKRWKALRKNCILRSGQCIIACIKC